jgi:DNA-damage-inducible protein J
MRHFVVHCEGLALDLPVERTMKGCVDHVSQLRYNQFMATPLTTMIHIRVNQDLKTLASDTLDEMGLSLSDAVRLLLKRIAVEKALPFDIRVPNAQTVAAMRAGDRGEVSRASSVAAMMAELNAND